MMSCRGTLNSLATTCTSSSSSSSNCTVTSPVSCPPAPSFLSTRVRARRRNIRRTIINSIRLTHHQKQQVHVWNLRPNKTRRSSLSFYAAASLDLPLLPFHLDQVLVPSESKTLHLYEARYLKLLDESLHKKSSLFVHFVLEPIVVSSRSTESSFAARYGCLVLIEKVEQLDVGALVSIRGIGRVTLVKFVKADPFIEGVVIPLQDNVPENISEVNSKVLELKEALQSLNSLEIKLKAAEDALLQTKTVNSLQWAEKKPSLDYHEAFIPSLAERVSFAALQLVSGSSESELLQLQKEKLNAMDVIDTQERLENSLKLVKDNVSVIAAKLAIQSLNLQ